MKRFALAFCLLALPSAALADGDYRWELAPHISYHFGGHFDAESGSPMGADLEVDQGPALGVAFDIPMTNTLQLELLLNHQESDLFADAGIFGPDIKTIETDITYAHIGLLAQFGRPEVTPYFVISGGVTHIDPDLPGAGADDRFSVSFGGGVKLFFTPWFGMRLEARGFWTELDNLEIGCETSAGGGRCQDYRDYLSQGEASVGLIFAW